MSKFPAATTTRIPASRSIASALSTSGTLRVVSTANDQFAIAGWPGMTPMILHRPPRRVDDGAHRSAHVVAVDDLDVDDLRFGRDA